MNWSRFLGLALAVATPAVAAGQRPEQLSPEVRQYVTVGAERVALIHATLIDGTGAPAQPDQTIIISGGRITAVGPAASTPVPAGATVVDLTGKTVIPGLVGVHDHMFYTTPQMAMVQAQYSHPRLYLGSGVTTVRTTGAFSPYAELNLKRGIEHGEVPGPRMHITAPYIISPGSNAELDEMGMHKLETPEAGRRLVRYWAEEGAEWIKAYTQISRPIFAAVVDEAHRHGMKVTGHLCSISFTEAVELGIDNIEHGFRTNSDYDRAKQPNVCPASHFSTLVQLDMNDPRVMATIRTMVSRHVAMSTTTVNEQLAPGRPGPDERTRAAMAPWIAEQETTRRAQLDQANPAGEIYPGMKEIYPKSRQFELMFARAGGILMAGVDPAFAALAGFGDQRNLELLVETGFTVPEAVRIMTLNGATALGVAGDLGSVAAGKLADLVVIDGDLLREPAAIRRTTTVFKDGVGYDAAKLIAAVRGQVGIR